MIFCLSCKKHTKDNDVIGKLTKNGKAYIFARCNICKKVKSKFAYVKEIKGDGFLSKIFHKFQYYE